MLKKDIEDESQIKVAPQRHKGGTAPGAWIQRHSDQMVLAKAGPLADLICESVSLGLYSQFAQAPTSTLNLFNERVSRQILEHFFNQSVEKQLAEELPRYQHKASKRLAKAIQKLKATHVEDNEFNKQKKQTAQHIEGKMGIKLLHRKEVLKLRARENANSFFNAYNLNPTSFFWFFNNKEKVLPFLCSNEIPNCFELGETFVDAIITTGTCPAFVIHENEQIPLRGLMSILLMAKLINDIDCLGARGGNVVYKVYENELKEKFAMAFLVDAGEAFHTFRQKHPKNIRFAAQDETSYIQFDKLNTEQKYEFLSTLKRVEKTKNIIKKLIKHHAYKHLLTHDDSFLSSKLETITQNIDELLSAYADDLLIYKNDSDYNLPLLFQAIQQDDVAAVQTLLLNGTSPLLLDLKTGGSALHFANSTAMLKTLSSFKQDLSLRDDCGNTILHMAAKQGNLEFLDAVYALNPALLNEENMRGQTALHVAAEFQHFAVARRLLKLNANPDLFDFRNRHFFADFVAKITVGKEVHAEFIKLLLKLKSTDKKTKEILFEEELRSHIINALKEYTKSLATTKHDKFLVQLNSSTLTHLILNHGTGLFNAHKFTSMADIKRNLRQTSDAPSIASTSCLA